MHPERRLPFDLLLALGTGVVVDVVVVDVFCALPAHEGPAGAKGQRDAALVRTGDGGTGGPRPYKGLDAEACPREGLVLWGAGAR